MRSCTITRDGMLVWRGAATNEISALDAMARSCGYDDYAAAAARGKKYTDLHVSFCDVPVLVVRDISLLTEACLWWGWACRPRVLTVDSPAEDTAAEEAWDAEGEVMASRASELHAMVRDQGAVIAALREHTPRGRWARRVARRAIRRVTGGADVAVTVHAFGVGWRDLGEAYVGVDVWRGRPAPRDLPIEGQLVVHGGHRGGRRAA